METRHCLTAPTIHRQKGASLVARQTYETWLPEEQDSRVMRVISNSSVVEAVARRLPMTTNSREFPRSGDMDVDVVPKGTAYGEDVSTFSEVTLTAKKFGRAVRIAEEDIDDAAINLIDDRKIAWANAYAKKIDNACLGTSAAVGTNVPFVSVYRAVTTADSDTGYTADQNHVGVFDADIDYDDLSGLLALSEDSDFYNDGSMIFIAHTSFRAVLRGLKDSNGDPIYMQGNIRDGQASTLFGIPIRFSRGAVVTATALSKPTPLTLGSAKGTAGNRLLVLCDPQHLMLGVRSGPESVVIDGRDGTSALTDETLLKIRARRAFAPAWPGAFSVLEWSGNNPA
jgi:HK97 family phage major capsid protein